jgi:hypothetical protein
VLPPTREILALGLVLGQIHGHQVLVSPFVQWRAPVAESTSAS